MDSADMISENSLANSHSSFWGEFFPWINEFCQAVNSYKLIQKTQPIQEIDKAEHRAINNTIAFMHYHNLTNCKRYNYKKSKKEALSFMSKLPRNGISTYKHNEADKAIIYKQVENLRLLYSTNLIIKPFFPGCGILNNSYGDIIKEDKLIEVKAGCRKIIPSDIKQLVVYLALNWLSGKTSYVLNMIEIYNPRIGYLWTISIHELFLSITDNTKEEMFEQMGKYLVTQSEILEDE